MAQLNPDPHGVELEDLVASHLVCRRQYVETGIKERRPAELLELDIVWTNYDSDPPVAHPVEVKSGEWGLGDVFKFFGWTRYLDLVPGQFVHKETCGRLDTASLEHVATRTGIRFLHVPTAVDVTTQLKGLGLGEPALEFLPELWQYSFWCQRLLLRSLNEAIKNGICPGTLKVAKTYYQLLNDAVFFEPDLGERIQALLYAHLDHRELALSAAHEMSTGQVNLSSPPQSTTFGDAYYKGKHFPIHTCLYLAHRARLYILKSLVDYSLARERGEIKKTTVKIGDALIELTDGKLSAAMASGINELSKSPSFRRFPALWQTFLWSWGGFLLKDRLQKEYEALSAESGVPVEEIPYALTAFDKLFPTTPGWFREPAGDDRRVLVLMPPTLRGLGAFRRRIMAGIDDYTKLGVNSDTAYRMILDNNTCVRHLDCKPNELTS